MSVPPSAEVTPGQEPASVLPSAEIVSEPEHAPVLPPAEAEAEQPVLYCPYCACVLADDYRFCPGCGHDMTPVLRCAHCGHEQFVPAELEPAHCLRCGQPFER